VTTTYTRAPEVEAIANRLIPRHHVHLVELGHVRIDYVFRSEAARSGGRTVAGKARKVTGLSAFLAIGDDAPEGRPDEDTPEVEPFFVVEVAADVWSALTPKQRRALVDHELSHLKVRLDDEDNLALSLAAHEVEEFVAVVERHRMWRPELEDLVKAATGTQLSLLGEEDDE